MCLHMLFSSDWPLICLRQINFSLQNLTTKVDLFEVLNAKEDKVVSHANNRNSVKQLTCTLALRDAVCAF